jgi:hypothetical protein
MVVGRRIIATSAVLAVLVGVADSSQAGQRSRPQVGASGRAQVLQATDESCYTQLDQQEVVAIPSQRMEPEFSIYNTRAVDDFAVAAPCRVQSVDVVGTFYDGLGPITSAEIVVYADKGARPGAVIARRTAAAPGNQDMGSFRIALPRSVPLAPGTYWLSVRVDMDFATGGQWGWLTSSLQHGVAARWKNPGDGFGTGCTAYRKMQRCVASVDPGPDLMFAVNSTR